LRVLAGVIIAMFFIEAGVFGYLRRPSTWLERLLFFAGGLGLMGARLITDVIGLALVGLAVLSHLFMPDIAIIGKRPLQKPMVDLSKIRWEERDTERLLTEVAAEAEL
jgi:hypothetical protein